ncbi:MAG TPA: hypothetical protein VFR64_19570 [Methylomirabilota bacterium]|jgi:hypothetical protein|nr:hypothetical protein [Methylomirabilota bacterium]
MPEERSLEGWAPRVGGEVTLAQVIDLAFDYRGDVTIVLADGRSLTGYVYNRDRDAADPYLMVFDPGGASHTVRYADVRTIRFTGRDTAAGASYEAWRQRKGKSQPA